MHIRAFFLHVAFLLTDLVAGQFLPAITSAASGFELFRRDGAHLSQAELMTRMVSRDMIRMERTKSVANDDRGPTTALTPITGEFLARVLVGTPPNPVLLIMDTAADLTWMKCSYNTNGNYPKNSSFFNSNNSTSMISMTCNNPANNCRPEINEVFKNIKHWCTRSGDCAYDLNYKTGTASGDFAKETFYINVTMSGKTQKVNGVIFGCTYELHQLDSIVGTSIHGVLALGLGKFSFASQVSSGIFSYCLGQHRNASGRLIFGPAPTSGSAAQQCTQLVQAAVDNTTTLRGVYVRRIRCNGFWIGKLVPKPERQSDDIWIMDSSQSFTSLPSDIYEMVTDSLNQSMSRFGQRVRLENSPLEYCYSGIGPSAWEEMKLEFEFADGKKVFSPVGSSLVIEGAAGVKCLSIIRAPAGSSHPVIGNLLQQGYWIQFEKSRMCFAKADCT